ncbi:MAG TPA: bifunctional lytic transglycosylase/C40 family peptidase [Thermomicrobiales bacterium]|nr:bifunctional lytic transglycosylase/C40 family peptidase [Thermomicrobiales bacterium]
MRYAAAAGGLGALGLLALPVVLCLVMAAVVVGLLTSLAGALTGAPGAPGGAVIGPGPATGEIPAAILALLPRAAGACPGLPWPVLAAIAGVESGFDARAVGPYLPQFADTPDEHALGMMQFLPSTYRGYSARVDRLTGKNLGADGIWDPESSLAAAALYLCDNGAPGDLRAAIYAYNHAGRYVDEVLAQAAAYGYLQPGSAGTAAVIPVAERYLGWPYLWGGASPQDGGFDCSGLVQYVFAQVGIQLPRTAAEQYAAVTLLPNPAELRPGDLLFFAQTYADPNDWITHVGIYLGNGQMINAPDEGERIEIVDAFTGFWGQHFVAGGRVRAATFSRQSGALAPAAGITPAVS